MGTKRSCRATKMSSIGSSPQNRNWEYNIFKCLEKGWQEKSTKKAVNMTACFGVLAFGVWKILSRINLSVHEHNSSIAYYHTKTSKSEVDNPNKQLKWLKIKLK